MFFSRYLYSKVVGARTKFVSLILGEEEVTFLEDHGIEYHKEKERYIVNCDELKSLFCHC